MRWLVCAVAVATAVEVVDAVGWWHWGKLQQHLQEDPGAGVSELVSDDWLALPPSVERSRRLKIDTLEQVSLSQISAGYARLAGLQQRWMPANAIAQVNRARSRLAQGDLLGGIEAAKQGELRDPTSAGLHRLLALLYRQAGYPKEFLEHAAQAFAIAPGLHQPRIEMAPEDEAWVKRESMIRALALYPRQRVQTRLALACNYWEHGQREEALELLDEVGETPEALLQRAQWSVDDAEYEAALSSVRATLENSRLPRRLRIQALSIKAQVLDLQGEHEQATQAAVAAVRLDPSSPAPHLALASMAQRRGDLKGSLEHLRRAWGVAPTDVAVLLRLASAAEAVGSYTDARVALERACELAQDRVDVAVRLIEFYLRRGLYTQATLELGRFLDRFPSDTRLVVLAEQLRASINSSSRQER